MAKDIARLVQRIRQATTPEEMREIVFQFAQDGRKRVTPAIRSSVRAKAARGLNAPEIRRWLIAQKGVRLSSPTIRLIMKENSDG